jgi:hypothetical protein
MDCRSIVVLLGLTLSATFVHAQKSGGWGGSRVSLGFAHRGGSARAYHHRFNPGFFLDGDPFLFADDSYEPPAPQPPAQVVLVESRPSASVEPEAKHDPLLIELQGDRYIRYEGEQQSTQRTTTAPADYAEKTAPPPQRSVATRPADLPPAVLVYRDGHQEKVSDYSIIAGILYARGNYWRDGYWSRNIEISSLNIPATMKASQQNGVNFVLPSAPNEVVTRP